MKIIITHDVDHLHWKEHWKDTYISGLIKRSLLNWKKGIINSTEMLLRLNPRRKLNFIDELAYFNNEMEVKATYFFAMRKGLNLSYGYKETKKYIEKLKIGGSKVAIHGQSTVDIKNFKVERDRFVQIANEEPSGIRNHYLQKSEDTFSIMEKMNYKYDSTDFGIKQPYKVGSMWEIPIQSMDGWEYKEWSKLHTNLSLLDFTKSKLAEAEKRKLPFYVINFHDVHFTPAYSELFNWYIDLITFLKSLEYEFIDFDDALTILNRNNQINL